MEITNNQETKVGFAPRRANQKKQKGTLEIPDSKN